MTFTVEQIKRLETIYGDSTLTVIKKYGEKALRVGSPRGDEMWVGGNSLQPFHARSFGPELPEASFLIIPPLRKVTVTDVIFRATGETRAPREGEWLRPGLNIVQAQSYFGTHYPIYTRLEVTREIEVPE